MYIWYCFSDITSLGLKEGEIAAIVLVLLVIGLGACVVIFVLIILMQRRSKGMNMMVPPAVTY